MSKSFCSGCKWVYIQASENNGKGFHYCDIFSKVEYWELKWRKLWCNGKAKERWEEQQ